MGRFCTEHGTFDADITFKEGRVDQVDIKEIPDSSPLWKSRIICGTYENKEKRIYIHAIRYDNQVFITKSSSFNAFQAIPVNKTKNKKSDSDGKWSSSVTLYKETEKHIIWINPMGWIPCRPTN